jgi:hypothetical protein
MMRAGIAHGHRDALRAARAKITIEIMLTPPFFRKPFALHHGLQ